MKNKKIINYLLEQGMLPSYKGFWYLHDIIKIIIKRKNKVESLSKCIYPVIAKKYKTTWRIVERDVRSLRDSCDNEKLKNMSCNEFIYYIALQIRLGKETECEKFLRENGFKDFKDLKDFFSEFDKVTVSEVKLLKIIDKLDKTIAEKDKNS